MSYSTYELSLDGAAPVELYRFWLGSEVWRYTSADVDITYQGLLYPAQAIQRPEIEGTGELARTNLPITVPVDFPVAQLFVQGPPAEVVAMSIVRVHRDGIDGDPPGDFIVTLWVGRVLNCEWTGDRAILHTEPMQTSIRASGLRRMYSRQCPHMLYGSSCGLDAGDWEAACTVAAVTSPIELAISGPHASTDGYFAGGALAWVDGAGRTQRRMIEAHESGAIVLMTPLAGLGVGAAVTLLPGCAHTLNECHTKFSNRINYGGFTSIPGTNPFTAPVF